MLCKCCTVCSTEDVSLWIDSRYTTFLISECKQKCEYWNDRRTQHLLSKKRHFPTSHISTPPAQRNSPIYHRYVCLKSVDARTNYITWSRQANAADWRLLQLVDAYRSWLTLTAAGWRFVSLKSLYTQIPVLTVTLLKVNCRRHDFHTTSSTTQLCRRATHVTTNQVTLFSWENVWTQQTK